jgi:hypothetical protein
LEWDDTASDNGFGQIYEVQRRLATQSDEFFEDLFPPVDDDLDFVDETASLGVTYVYRVRTQVENGDERDRPVLQPGHHHSGPIKSTGTF